MYINFFKRTLENTTTAGINYKELYCMGSSVIEK